MSTKTWLTEVIGESLAEIPGFIAWTDDAHGDLAEALLTAGYRKPRIITTAEELDALPFESVVRDAEGFVLERWGEPKEHLWATPMNSAYIPQADIALPATVLHEGEAAK